MICTTIHNKSFEEILDILPRCEMAEIRLDSCKMTKVELDECFSSDVPLVATCRISSLIETEPSLQDESLSDKSKAIRAAQIAQRRLCQAVEAGARYVDVELEAPKQMSKAVRQCAHENGSVFIRSFHDYEGTDSKEGLSAIVEKCLYHGADIVKIATTASSEADVTRVMSLYETYGREGRLLAFCMGEAGKSSRMDCLSFGAPFTYAALNESETSAPGQWDADIMKAELYGNFRFGSRYLKDTASLNNVDPVSMPVSKSYAQRAIIAAALADGISHLRNYTECGDNESALKVAAALGAKIVRNGSELEITGIAATAGCLAAEELFVGESGLLTRIMIPLLAQLSNAKVLVSGEKTLLHRPLSGAVGMMEACGVKVYNASDSQPDSELRVPLYVQGSLSPGRIDVSGSNGSQLISGMLMALPFCEKNSTLSVREPKSIPYMFITLEVLKKFGIKVSNEMLGGRDFLESDGDWSLCTDMIFKVKGGQKFKAADIDLEGDWSAAANLLVAAAIFGKAEIHGLDTTSLQADLSVMDILMDAGASLSQTDGDRGPVAVQRAPLAAFATDASNCPDLFPIISILAAFCDGTSRISGLGRLSNKESDRAGAILEMLGQMGVDAKSEDDVLVIKGYSLARRLLAGKSSSCSSFVNESGCLGLLKGGKYSSHNDHRMAMALAVAGLGAETPIEVDDTECVAKSFPEFYKVFATVVG